jgi:biopolymer transport protein ExbB
LLNHFSHPLSKVLAAILYNSNKGKDAIESASSIEIQKVLPYIQNGTNYINMCANIATLLGLLGTIQGLIESFTSLNGVSGAEKSAILAQGISTAMNTTAFGLVVAIPCVIFYTILTNKEESILKKYDETISEVTHLVVFKPHAETVNEDPNSKEYRRYGT